MNKKGARLFWLLFAVLCILPVPSLSAAGKQAEEEIKPLNNEWILCVTAFDISRLPPARHLAGSVITRELITKLKTVSYRLRLSPEYAYYEGYAWQQSLSTAAKAVSAKQTQRSELLFRGDPEWKYRSELKKIDAELVKLREELAKKETEKPLINNEPVFSLLQANLSGTFPELPKPGTERRFCQNQKIDAFLSGEIHEFHGRYFIKLRLYTLYTSSFVYEDDIIFSMEDTNGAVEEIAARLMSVLSGNKPASVAVKADPPEAQVLINQNFAGRGTVEEREHPPGKIAIAVAAEGYSPQMVETELLAGEMADVSVQLSPLHFADVNLDVRSNTNALVYQGSLYMGETPLTLRLPINQLNYVSLETRQGETSKAVFSSPDMPEDRFDIGLRTKIPPPEGERRVNRARYWHYWAWGGAWLTGIAAWISSGIYSSQNGVLSRSSSYDFYDSTNRMYYISTGAIILVGAAVVHEVVQMIRYLYVATENVTPIVKQERPRK
jgi:hypothetical protein